MSDRVKITFDKEYFNEKETIMINGVSIEVKKRIPYGEKLKMAAEYASLTVVIDEAQEIAYEVYETDAVKSYLYLKYYTNIDLESFDVGYGEAHDFFMQNLSTFCGISENDFNEAVCFSKIYLERTIEIYRMSHSLEAKAKSSLAGLLNEDILKVVSESKMLNDELIDLLHRPKQTDNVTPIFEAFAKKGE